MKCIIDVTLYAKKQLVSVQSTLLNGDGYMLMVDKYLSSI